MPPLYDIAVKNTFLEFNIVDPSNESEQGLQKTLSCPNLSFKTLSCPNMSFLTTQSEAGEETDSSGSPDAASSVSTDRDIPPNKGVNQKGVKKLQVQDVSISNCSLGTALAMQVRLNKQLMQARRGRKRNIFTLVRTQIHQMNAVNLSTAIHRIARLGGPGENDTVVVEALLNVIEEQTWRELAHHDDSMTAGCATIVAWSCASLQVFQHDLFGALIQVVELGLTTCKDFEVTNLLWACAQLVKHLPIAFKASKGGLDPAQGVGWLPERVGRPLCALMDAVEVYFQGRLQNMTGSVLVSALVSVAILSAAEDLSVTTLFSSICHALALRYGELSFHQKEKVGIAGRIMRKHNARVVQAVGKSVSEKCPELAIHFRV
eukprot:s2351_g10.t1